MAIRRFRTSRGIKGKVVERIQIDTDDYAKVDIQFQDGTSLGIQINWKTGIDFVDLLGWKEGNSFVIRRLLR